MPAPNDQSRPIARPSVRTAEIAEAFRVGGASGHIPDFYALLELAREHAGKTVRSRERTEDQRQALFATECQRSLAPFHQIATRHGWNCHLIELAVIDERSLAQFDAERADAGDACELPYFVSAIGTYSHAVPPGVLLGCWQKAIGYLVGVDSAQGLSIVGSPATYRHAYILASNFLANGDDPPSDQEAYQAGPEAYVLEAFQFGRRTHLDPDASDPVDIARRLTGAFAHCITSSQGLEGVPAGLRRAHLLIVPFRRPTPRRGSMVESGLDAFMSESPQESRIEETYGGCVFSLLSPDHGEEYESEARIEQVVTRTAWMLQRAALLEAQVQRRLERGDESAQIVHTLTNAHKRLIWRTGLLRDSLAAIWGQTRTRELAEVLAASRATYGDAKRLEEFGRVANLAYKFRRGRSPQLPLDEKLSVRDLRRTAREVLEGSINVLIETSVDYNAPDVVWPASEDGDTSAQYSTSRTYLELLIPEVARNCVQYCGGSHRKVTCEWIEIGPHQVMRVSNTLSADTDLAAVRTLLRERVFSLGLRQIEALAELHGLPRPDMRVPEDGWVFQIDVYVGRSAADGE